VKSTVAIYNTHWTALHAVEVLKNKDYPVDQLSILGMAKIVDDLKKKKSKKQSKNTGMSAGIILGSTLGVLPGAGIFAVPGFGYIFGAGAVKKELADYVIGFAGQEIDSILTTVGIKKETVVKYSDHLKKGEFLVIAQGYEEEVENAMNILCNSGNHLELCIH
jgi:uncharacterized membrane protein